VDAPNRRIGFGWPAGRPWGAAGSLPAETREQEVDALKSQAGDLQAALADVVKRTRALESKDAETNG